jgi:hypothetical protein
VSPAGSRLAEERTHFYEKPWFRATAAVVGMVATLATLVGIFWGPISDLFSSELPASNTEIVLDASEEMADEFDEGDSKLEAAAAGIGEFVAPRANEGFALRRFGGDCGEAGDLVVDFGADNGDDVRDAAAEQEPSGASNLGNAVIAALDDFNDQDKFPDQDAPRRVLIFAGTADQCLGDDAADVIRREVGRSAVDLEFQLVGMKVSDAARAGLKSITNELGREAALVVVDDNEELEDVVEMETPIGTTGEQGATAP